MFGLKRARCGLALAGLLVTTAAAPDIEATCCVGGLTPGEYTFDITFDVEDTPDLDSILADLGVSLTDFDPTILDAEG